MDEVIYEVHYPEELSLNVVLFLRGATMFLACVLIAVVIRMGG